MDSNDIKDYKESLNQKIPNGTRKMAGSGPKPVITNINQRRSQKPNIRRTDNRLFHF